jgi:hypothetical protein
VPVVVVPVVELEEVELVGLDVVVVVVELAPLLLDAIVVGFPLAPPPCAVLAGDVVVEGFWLEPCPSDPGMVGLDELPFEGWLPLAPLPRPWASIAAAPKTMTANTTAANRNGFMMTQSSLGRAESKIVAGGRSPGSR